MTGKNKVGRKKIYKNAAARQKAYRERQKKQKNSTELRLNLNRASKKSLERIANHKNISIAEAVELLIKNEETIILRKICRNAEPLDRYMLN